MRTGLRGAVLPLGHPLLNLLQISAQLNLLRLQRVHDLGLPHAVLLQRLGVRTHNERVRSDHHPMRRSRSALVQPLGPVNLQVDGSLVGSGNTRYWGNPGGEGLPFTPGIGHHRISGADLGFTFKVALINRAVLEADQAVILFSVFCERRSNGVNWLYNWKG